MKIVKYTSYTRKSLEDDGWKQLTCFGMDYVIFGKDKQRIIWDKFTTVVISVYEQEDNYVIHNN